MTNEEKNMLKTKEFEEIWFNVWGKTANFSHYKNEETISKEKFNQLKYGINGLYNLSDLVDASITKWEEPEWGFPKGRRNYNETDLECSVREFNEETGFNLNKCFIVHNISPFEEIFCGSNYKSYKHKYFLTYMDFENSEPVIQVSNEISDIKWKSYADCITLIRSYNLEKKRMLSNIDILLKKTTLVQ
jgi:8-oxo-dGTP pyrophosphatase MutT (NUDIX family)